MSCDGQVKRFGGGLPALWHPAARRLAEAYVEAAAEDKTLEGVT